jgi:predicted RNase H-like HicB family nuclease
MMSKTIAVEARWIRDDGIWIATSPDVPGLVVEGATWTDMILEVRLVLPDLLEMAGRGEAATLVFRAEEHLDLAAA